MLLTQTQCVVMFADLAGAAPAAIGVDRLWYLFFHQVFLTDSEAEHGVHMLIAHQSATIVFAIVTGVLLWLSSLATGWTANYLALTRMKLAILRGLPVRRRLGERNAVCLANWTSHYAAGAVGYTVLGLLLGTILILVSLFGIPLEVRHVTLSAVSFGFALDALWLGGRLNASAVLWPVVGIVLIGILNISTSFVLRILLAIRAGSIEEHKARALLHEVKQEFRARPLSFFIPGEY